MAGAALQEIREELRQEYEMKKEQWLGQGEQRATREMLLEA